MIILINDQCGHPFQIQLSRYLASQGYKIIHTYAQNFQTPKGNLLVEDNTNDPVYDNLKVIGINYNSQFEKYSFFKRIQQEIEYGIKLNTIIELHKPNFVISANTPLFAQQVIQKFCIKNNIKFIIWCQDIYSVAIKEILKKRFNIFSYPLYLFFKNLEKKQFKKSNHLINISCDFNAIQLEWGIEKNKISVIPNWAPIKELPIKAKINQWSQKLNLGSKFCITYSGTLGLKHNPSLLVDLAKKFEMYDDVVILIISEGIGAEYIQHEIEKKQINNIKLLPFQSFNEMPFILGFSDILIAILEPEAGIFSVPSKVLTYMCAGKPLVLSVPSVNLSSRIVRENNAGFVVEPSSKEEFFEKIILLYQNPSLRNEFGKNALDYAKNNFDIDLISKRFINIINSLG
jgi:colanic acid biosynthesis glycosyl transferase WcaI